MKKRYKVQAAGKGQLRITIPALWAKHHHIKQGDKLIIEFNDGPILKIYPITIVQKPDVRLGGK